MSLLLCVPGGFTGDFLVLRTELVRSIAANQAAFELTLSEAVTERLGMGRAGERLGELVAIARALTGSGSGTRGSGPSDPLRNCADPCSRSAG